MKGEPTVPAPWTTANSFARPDKDGKVSINATGSGLNTEAAIALRRINHLLPNAALSALEQGSRIAIWLIARRLGAPLDRFSVHFLDGVFYDLIQLVHLEHRRVRGDLEQTTPEPLREHELPIFLGSFLSSKPSLLPEDPSSARLTGPVASEIGLFNQVHKIAEPRAPQPTDMDKTELRAVVLDILDNLELFPDDPKAREGKEGTRMPRLGFDFIPLTITMPFLRRTGRLVNPDKSELVVEVTGPGLGFDARQAIAQALEFRIRDRVFQGKEVVLRPEFIPGKGEVGNVTMTLAPIPRGPGADPRTQPNLILRPDVLANMAEGWACTEFLKDPEFLEVGEREFGRAYMMDRDKTISASPPDRLEMGRKNEENEGAFTLFLPCLSPTAGVALGSFHTHPVTITPPEPSEKDLEYAKDCGGQHFIVTDNKAFRYFPDGTVNENPINLPKAPGCRKINLEGIKIVDL
jgi:hypothetical protein